VSKHATKRVRYIGAEGLTSPEVGAATGQGDLLVPGMEYEVPASFAERLLASSPLFELVSNRGRTVTVAPANAEEGNTDA
jgi:hypothetical protein